MKEGAFIRNANFKLSNPNSMRTLYLILCDPFDIPSYFSLLITVSCSSPYKPFPPHFSTFASSKIEMRRGRRYFREAQIHKRNRRYLCVCVCVCFPAVLRPALRGTLLQSYMPNLLKIFD